MSQAALNIQQKHYENLSNVHKDFLYQKQILNTAYNFYIHSENFEVTVDNLDEVRYVIQNILSLLTEEFIEENLDLKELLVKHHISTDEDMQSVYHDNVVDFCNYLRTKHVEETVIPFEIELYAIAIKEHAVNL